MEEKALSVKEVQGRLGRFRDLLAKEKLDGFIVVSPDNRRYLSGFTGSSGILVFTGDRAVLFTDFRYLEQAAVETTGTGIDLRKQGKKIWESVAALLQENAGESAGKCWGFEADHLVEKDYRFLAGRVGAGRLVPKEGFSDRLRAVKSPAEIELIAKATAVTDWAWERLLPHIKPGRREEELAALFEFFQREEGASSASFPTLVASGPRSALPHGAAGGRVFCPGDLVVIDGGAVYEGYCSDFTRTVVVGSEPGAEQERIYRLVLAAQERALSGLKPGMTAAEADALAREVVEEAGYGSNFGHGLGHGLGLNVHEAPHLAPNRETVLEPGMVVTIEPGIYVPDWGGVRIEDVAVITQGGRRILTRSPKTLFL